MSQHNATSGVSVPTDTTIRTQSPTPELQEAIVVCGNGPLQGDVHISGAKNSVLKLFAAALLAPGTYTFTNVPKIIDIPNMLELVKSFGADYTITSGELVDVVEITVFDTINPHVPPELFKKLRASIQCLGPVVTRAGEITISTPGGDKIGERNIDMHLNNLKRMGAQVEAIEDGFRVWAPHGLHGEECKLEFASVGATETIVLAATLAKGTTVIESAAREPEIVDLCTMLRNMGAKITGDSTSTITIEGQPELHAISEPHHVVPDRIEAGTYIAAALITQGDVTIHRFDPALLQNPIDKLVEAGAQLVIKDNLIRVKPSGRLASIDISTLAYPGWPTDLLAPYMVVLSQTLGDSNMTETVFGKRMGVVKELQSIGMQCHLSVHTLLLESQSVITGGKVFADDIRAGAALVLAGLISQEDVEVFNIFHIDRGYSEFVPKLRALGANIQRVKRPVA